jgi:hypothetical protein
VEASGRYCMGHVGIRAALVCLHPRPVWGESVFGVVAVTSAQPRARVCRVDPVVGWTAVGVLATVGSVIAAAGELEAAHPRPEEPDF